VRRRGRQRTGRPLGSDGFVAHLQQRLGRTLAKPKPGRKAKSAAVMERVWCPPIFRIGRP